MKVPKYQDWPHKFLIPQYQIFWLDNQAALFTGKPRPPEVGEQPCGADSPILQFFRWENWGMDRAYNFA